MNKQKYVIGNDTGKTATVMLSGHTQHIWHTSYADASDAVKARIKSILGVGPYTNPRGNFGAAQKIVIR